MKITRKIKRKLKKMMGKEKKSTPAKDRKYQILLLTNRDSDNVGDQVIEATDISLVKAAMKNLGISGDDVNVDSRAASIVTQNYLRKKDPALLANADNIISKSSVVLFGGAPVFNYLYQNFYERTAVTIELAEKHGKPVLFSAVGVDGYDEDNERCQRIVDKINSDAVVQVTTRDNIDALGKYMRNPKIPYCKVADPAVFSERVFEPYLSEKKKKPTVGLFIFRAHGFTDNNIPFTAEDSVEMWLGLKKELESRGYAVEFLTSGHFGDEAFMDLMIREYGVSADDCVFNINCPEDLIGRISSYKGVVSCRLHPSIISFALGVPALGIVWNSKVEGFYRGAGYEDRLVYTDNMTVTSLADRLEAAMSEPVNRDKEFMMSVYNTLFEGLKKSLRLDTDAKPYTYDELIEALRPYGGTSEKAQKAKLQRKFRRIYELLNRRDVRIHELKKELAELKENQINEDNQQ